MNGSNVELIQLSKTFDAGRSESEVAAVIDLNLEIQAGEFFTLLGPSGCGKTTTLRMVAGFESPTSGEIRIGGRLVNDLPPNRRPVNTVFQNYALFPHLTVGQNVAFGLALKRLPAAERLPRVRAALDLVRLSGIENRKPNQLSGGQQQRVALARALINEPSVLLLDEPLGALDQKLRKEVQLELKHLQSQLGITFIYVTHDQEEALTMSDRIAVMNEGVVQQVGSPRDIYEHPTNRFVADFIGETNFISGRVTRANRLVCVDIGGVEVLSDSQGREFKPGQAVTLTVRPEKINLYPYGQGDILKAETGIDAKEIAAIIGLKGVREKVDIRAYLEAETDNVVLDGEIQEAIYIGTDIRYRVALTGQTSVFVRMQNFGTRYDTTFEVGSRVYVNWPAENAKVLAD
ncbi:MAG: ABC transporter ATP-binding protein [Anaerolineales bacterium]|nr:ABC transporter ATP-binding protein [Anaerolineales bacterium]